MGGEFLEVSSGVVSSCVQSITTHRPGRLQSYLRAMCEYADEERIRRMRVALLPGGGDGRNLLLSTTAT